MQPLYYRLLLPNKPQRAVLHVRGVARREPHPWRHVGHALQEIAEPLPLVPPGVYSLPQQRDVAGPTLHQPLDLAENVLHRSADHAPPHRRYYAVAALVIAPRHDGDERAVLALGARELRRVGLLHRR